MKNTLVKLIVNIISLALVVKFIPGIHADGWRTVVVAAIVLTIANTFLKPVIILFTLPFNILSLGLFTLVVNGFMFYMVSKIVGGFSIVNFWDAVLGALIFSIASIFLNVFVSPTGSGKVKFGFYRSGDSCRKKYDNVIDVEAEDKSGSPE